MSNICDWCDGAGCDECDWKGKTGDLDAQQAPQSSMCDNCDGKGCASCNPALATATNEDPGPCDWCDGQGCVECGDVPYKPPASSQRAPPAEPAVPVCEWCDGVGCDECGFVVHASQTAAAPSGADSGQWGEVDVGWSTDMDSSLTVSERLTNQFYGVEYENNKVIKMKGLQRVVDLAQEHPDELSNEARNCATRALTTLCLLAIELEKKDEAFKSLDALLHGPSMPTALRQVLALGMNSSLAEELCRRVVQSGQEWAVLTARVPIVVMALQAVDTARTNSSPQNIAHAEAATSAALAMLPEKPVEKVVVQVLSALQAVDPYQTLDVKSLRGSASTASQENARDVFQARVLRLVMRLNLAQLCGNPYRELAVELEGVMNQSEAASLEGDMDVGKVVVAAWMAIGALYVEKQQWRRSYLAYYKAFVLAMKGAPDAVNKSLAMAIVTAGASSGADVAESNEAKGIVSQASIGSLLDCAVKCATAAATGDAATLEEEIGAWERACAAHGEAAGRKVVFGLWCACLSENVRAAVKGRSSVMLGPLVKSFEKFLPKATIDSVLTLSALAMPGATLDLSSLCLTVSASMNAYNPLTGSLDAGAAPIVTRRDEALNVRPHGLQSVGAFPIASVESKPLLLRVKDAANSAENVMRARAAAGSDIVTAMTMKVVSQM